MDGHGRGRRMDGIESPCRGLDEVYEAAKDPAGT